MSLQSQRFKPAGCPGMLFYIYVINIIYYFSQTSPAVKIFGLSVVDRDHLPANRFYLLSYYYRIPYPVSLLVNVPGTVVLAKGLKPETEIRD